MLAAITDNQLGASRASTQAHLDELLEEPSAMSERSR